MVENVFGFSEGCITSLSLLNIESKNKKELNFEWVLDNGVLLEPNKVITICAGCMDPKDHTQHHVVDITPQLLLNLINQHSNIDPILFDFGKL